jgi:hypothetical protein
MSFHKLKWSALLIFCIFLECGFDTCGVTPQAGTGSGGFPVTTYYQAVDSSSDLQGTYRCSGQ